MTKPQTYPNIVTSLSTTVGNASSKCGSTYLAVIGIAAGAATTMPKGNAPAVFSSGSSVTLRWMAATLPGGTSVAGYVISRYDINGGAQTVNAACSGVITTTICTDQNVPSGTWLYTDTPVQGGWTGGQSAATSVTV